MAEKTGYNRREFLKILGAGGGLVAAGCGEKVPEKLIPYVVQPDEVIPGIATWYASSCNECSAGCGILVRNREGRAVKIEGNPHHPVNRGGLCTLGQSSLQALYDPDRIREPLMRSGDGALKVATWENAVTEASKALSSTSPEKKLVLLTGRLSGSESQLARDFVGKFKGAEHIEFELLNSDTLDVAAELCFGSGARTRFNFSQADVIVSFGADFLETWQSPCEYARDWSSRRKPSGDGVHGADNPMSYFVHVEPRLSLTAGNADRWIKNAPGSEAALLAALLKLVVDQEGDSKFSAQERQLAQSLTKDVDIDKISQAAGVESALLKKLAETLRSARQSLVVAGGAATSGESGELCAVLANILNAALGNIGKTVLISKSNTPSGYSYQRVRKLISDMKESKVQTLIVSGVNPAFALSDKSGFREGLAKVSSVITISTQLDETASLGQVVIPLSTSLESWMDAEPVPGVYNITQPSMQPLYATQSLADTLIALGAKLDFSFDGAGSAYDYIRTQWKRRTGESDFESRWKKYVEKGGDWSSAQNSSLTSSLSEKISSVSAQLTKALAPSSGKAKVLMAYPSVNFFDGRSANRPWLQELPNPVSGVVWGSWVEMHPSTIAELGLQSGDTVQIKTEVGVIEAGLHATEHIHPSLVAVPIGQGHSRFGRYATGLGVNPLSVLSAESSGNISLTTSAVSIGRAPWADKIVRTQDFTSQLNRELARTLPLTKLLAMEEEHHNGNGHHEEASHGAKHGGHHGPAYGPQDPPPQMYNQMKHPLYRWGMTIDLAKCTGCSACSVACYAENNIPVAGKELCSMGREMSWIRIDRYLDGPPEQPVTGLMPMMCQHCGNAPCEPVCPVYATYHNEQGLNVMVYNRCVGTRYCSNNCSYKVRRFNWFKYDWPEPSTWQLNPDVTVREVGVMEKCTFCIQRVRESENHAKNLGRPISDGEVQPACASSCPTQAITFGNLDDKNSAVFKESQSARGYKCLDDIVNTQPAITYLARVRNDKVKLA